MIFSFSLSCLTFSFSVVSSLFIPSLSFFSIKKKKKKTSYLHGCKQSPSFFCWPTTPKMSATVQFTKQSFTNNTGSCTISMSSQVHQTCSPAPPFAGAHLSSDPNWYPDIGATHHMTAMPLHNTQSYSAALIMSIWVMVVLCQYLTLAPFLFP